MVCSQCYGFVFDHLVHPPDPAQHTERTFQTKRFRKIAPEISKMVVHLLEKTPISEYNLCEQQDLETNRQYGILKNDILVKLHFYYRSLRLFKFFLKRNPSFQHEINHILLCMMESCVFSKEKSKIPYEDWLAVRFIFLLQHLPSIHLEHSKQRPISDGNTIFKLATPTHHITYIDIDDDLYT
jgi:hypothetical protein